MVKKLFGAVELQRLVGRGRGEEERVREREGVCQWGRLEEEWRRGARSRGGGAVQATGAREQKEGQGLYFAVVVTFAMGTGAALARAVEPGFGGHEFISEGHGRDVTRDVTRGETRQGG